MPLAIVAGSFNKSSETFIRAHVRDISPGRTVLLCRDVDGADAMEEPVLSVIRGEPGPRHLGERMARSIRWRLQHYIDPALRGADERRVRTFLLHHGVTAVLAEYGMNGLMLRVACLRTGIPLYTHFHGYDATSGARTAERRWQYRRLFRDAAGIVAPSEFLVDRLRTLGCPPHKLHVSPCGIDLAAFQVKPGEHGRILAVGRLVEKKSPLSTLRAFARVAAVFSEAHLDMVGDGPLREVCLREIRDQGLGARVTMHGARPHATVTALMGRSSLYVQHSVESADGDCEGLPVGILEAMGSGLPVVSTWHSGIPEAVSHGETGLLVAEHDVDGMAEAMISLLKDPELGERMGRAGRARVEARFTNEQTASRLREIMGLGSR